MTYARHYQAFLTLARKEVLRVLRIWSQTLLPPVVTTTIYFVVFGSFLGSRIQPLGEYSYIQFIFPGLIMMTTITNSFSNVASSFYSAKFQKSIEELLVAPLSDGLIIGGYISGGIVRGVLCGLLVMIVGLFFTRVPVLHPGLIIVYLLLTATLFSLAGLANAVYAKSFDDISIIPTFVLTPLTYFAGVFYSINLLPPTWRTVSLFNPIFYMVDGFRYGFLGISDASIGLGLAILVVSNAALLALILYFFKNGAGLRS